MTVFSRIYLDTNILITAAEDRSQTGVALREIFLAPAREGVPFFLTSELAIAEVLVRPFRDRNADLAMQYLKTILADLWLGTRPITPDILEVAALLRSTRIGLKLPDAIHIATASFIRPDIDILKSVLESTSP
jgi:predicted nucleic acid-binding protein